MHTRVPEDWIEEHHGAFRLRKNRQQYLPQPIRISDEGRDAEEGTDCAFLPAPFRFCPSCGVAYGLRQTRDFAKLSQLGSEGRSTATTILSLSTILGLKDSRALPIAPASS